MGTFLLLLLLLSLIRRICGSCNVADLSLAPGQTVNTSNPVRKSKKYYDSRYCHYGDGNYASIVRASQVVETGSTIRVSCKTHFNTEYVPSDVDCDWRTLTSWLAVGLNPTQCVSGGFCVDESLQIARDTDGCFANTGGAERVNTALLSHMVSAC